MFNYRDKLSSDVLNKELNKYDRKIDELLEIHHFLKRRSDYDDLIQVELLNSISSLQSTLSTTGLSLTHNSGVLLPLYIPSLSKNIAIEGGAFTIDKERKPSVYHKKHGPVDVTSLNSVRINGIELDQLETDIFGSMVANNGWFIKEMNDLSLDECTVSIDANFTYSCNEVIITSLPFINDRIRLNTPGYSQKSSNYYLIDDIASGTINFTIPTVNNKGSKYLVLKNISFNHIILKPYSEIVIPIRNKKDLYLTNINMEGQFNTNQIRLLINTYDSYMIDLYDNTSKNDNISDTILTTYDSNEDTFPLGGTEYSSLGSYKIIDDIVYLHIILYNSDVNVPYINKVSWRVS